MKLLVPQQRSASNPRRGAVLMLAMLVLFVLLLIVFQISIVTGTDARVSRNEQTIKAMDLAIESILLEAFENLKQAGEDAGAEDAMGAGMGAMGDAMGGEGAGEAASSADSRQSPWADPITGNLNEVDLRAIIQDEDSKFNVLSILTENEDEAQKAYDRLVRIIEYSRKGTDHEIDSTDADKMARAILEYMNRRKDQALPKTELLSDDEDREDWGMPLSLRELIAAAPEVFQADHFRDFEDEYGRVVHSLGTFLTVWTSLDVSGTGGTSSGGTGGAPGDPVGDPAGSSAAAGAEATSTTMSNTGEQAGVIPGEGSPAGQLGSSSGMGGSGEAGSIENGTPGVAVNVNTAPLAVLKGLIDDRDVPYGFWESVLEYRNEEEEVEVESILSEEEFEELDEFGDPVEGPFQVFDTLDELNELDGWNEVEPITQSELQALLTTESHVFSIFVTARKPTAADAELKQPENERERRDQERNTAGLVRTVRCVVWRRKGADGEFEIIPLQRWEVLDYAPIEVQDFPEDDER